MNKILFSFVLMLLGLNLNAQNTLKNDTLYLAKGGFLVKGENIKLGKGAKDNGYFKNIEVSASNMFRAYNTNGTNFGVQEANSMSSHYNDLEGKIIRFEERGTKRSGKKFIVIIGVGDIARYQVDIDNAIEDGEVILPEYKRTKNNSNQNNSSISLADELKKLKELHDSGILSDKEFEDAKAKILEKL